VNDVGTNATPTYVQSIVPFLPVGFNIDHVISDKLKGSCWTAGIGGRPPVATAGYFDHNPRRLHALGVSRRAFSAGENCSLHARSEICSTPGHA
jgi:hypothetical protein